VSTSEIFKTFKSAYREISVGQKSDWVHPDKSPEGQPLRTLTYFRPGDPERLIISISGTHGPEAYIGSLIQAEILKNLPIVNAQSPSLLFIHNLNCFGSAWCRRPNHQNMDLNRNGWRGEIPENLGFAEFLPLVSSRTWAEYAARFAMDVPKLLTQGLPRVSGAIAGGQARYPDSLFFAGRERSFELRQLVHLFADFKPRKVSVLEIHTGLGPSAYESLLQEKPIPPALSLALRAKFQHPLVDLTQNQQFYAAQGSIAHLLEECFPDAERLHLTQEFGTHHFVRVLGAMAIENRAWNDGRHDDPARLKMLQEIFFPASPAWRKKTLAAGVRRFFDMMELI
jgi:hypothetical protein